MERKSKVMTLQVFARLQFAGKFVEISVFWGIYLIFTRAGKGNWRHFFIEDKALPGNGSGPVLFNNPLLNKYFSSPRSTEPASPLTSGRDAGSRCDITLKELTIMRTSIC